jgi:hypothetical protein
MHPYMRPFQTPSVIFRGPILVLERADRFRRATRVAAGQHLREKGVNARCFIILEGTGASAAWILHACKWPMAFMHLYSMRLAQSEGM